MRKILLIIPLLIWAVCVHSQNISVSAPTNVVTGENFRLAYTVNTQNIDNFRSGNIPNGLEIIAGPYTSSQSSFQMVNGHTSSSSSVTYTYTLYAEKAGVYTIPGAFAQIGGRKVVSRAIKIKVTGTTRKNGNSPKLHDDDANSGVRAQGTHINGNDLFVKVNANKRIVHEQEPILLTYKVYTLVDLTQLDGKMPDLTGFHTQEIKLPAQKSFHVENVNGRNYRCVTWSQYVMYPQMTGILKIPSITFKGIVVQQNKSVDPFEAFFNGGSGYVEVKRDIIAPGLSVKVEPLPAKPSDFSGGVGVFSIAAQADKRKLKAGNPLNVRVTISGMGNLKLLKQPDVAFPKDFDKYDAKVTDKTKLTTNGIEGSMVYDFLAVPRNQGTYTIPPVVLSYYDTKMNAYRTIQSQPIQLVVEKGKNMSETVDDYSEDLPKDILPIKTGDVTLVLKGDHFFLSRAYWFSIGGIIALFTALFICLRKRASYHADIVKMKGKAANKVAIKRLRVANKLLINGEHESFYDEVLKALWGYVGNKLNISVEHLSRENISYKLKEINIEENTIDKFLSALDECEYERFAPGDIAGNMQKTYQSAFDAIMEIENAMRKNKVHVKLSRMRGVIIVVMSLTCLSVQHMYAVSKSAADTEYQNGNYHKAISDYKSLLKEGECAEIYYNLGNCYFRTDNIPQSILAYERASLLAPSDKSILYNLCYVKSKTADKIVEHDTMFYTTFYHYILNRFSMDGWAVFSIVSLILVLVLLLVYLFFNNIVWRKIGFCGAILGILSFILSSLMAIQQYMKISQRDEAIVVQSIVDVKNVPSVKGSNLFVIHEGTKVKITDDMMKEWYSIKLEDGREGWIKRTQVELI